MQDIDVSLVYLCFRLLLVVRDVGVGAKNHARVVFNGLDNCFVVGTHAEALVFIDVNALVSPLTVVLVPRALLDLVESEPVLRVGAKQPLEECLGLA